MWLLPISVEMKGKGFYYPQIPEITMADLNFLHKESSRAHNSTFTVDELDSDPRDYIKKAIEKYSGNTFLISQDG